MATSSGAPKPPMAANEAKHGRMRHVLHNVTRRTRHAALLVGAGATLAAILNVREQRRVEKEFQGDKKRVLVLPFHRMKLVEKRRFSLEETLKELMEDEHSGHSRTVEVEVKELVDVIHKAAQDPNVVALYGVFGHGFTSSVGGWAQVEEVRTAIKVFQESHRVHREPNLKHQDVLIRNGNGIPKSSFAFADSFANPMDGGNKEYYLASAFSHVHLQSQGELNLFGVGASNMFLRGALDKYGVKAHVFKHGKYKNAPNSFTERGFSKDHQQNVTNIVNAINHLIYDRVVQSRKLQAMDSNVWKMVHGHGTFTASQAVALGFVDYTPQLDPLNDLVHSNKNERNKQKMMMMHGSDADLHSFPAKEKISFFSYKRLLDKRKKREERAERVHSLMSRLAAKSTATESTLSALGYKGLVDNTDGPASSRSAGEKVSLIYINGGIDESTARKTIAALQRIEQRDGVKAVVLRVNSPGGSVNASERILQQIRDMSQPVVVSFGNVAASGGYYVSAECDRIFALPNTITGSIGVFGVKLDLSDFAARYGIRVEHVAGGPHTFTFSPFHPLTRPMKANFARSIDRYYNHFKSLVANGRGLSLEQVETIAQGRVWTGEQAKAIGLVDEIGGLDRALAYAKRKYTNGDAVVEVWPKSKSFMDRIFKESEDSSSTKEQMIALVGSMLGFDMDSSTCPGPSSGIDSLMSLLAAHELGRGVFTSGTPPVSLPGSLSGIMLTADENLAVQNVLLGCLGSNRSAGPWESSGFWD